ncbi:MAG: transcription-repair coupling factor [Marinifilaceae bacterium]|nr:transcription-repair coupling factor [Marinifilaceae bacterium]
MEIQELIRVIENNPKLKNFNKKIKQGLEKRNKIEGIQDSYLPFLVDKSYRNSKGSNVIIFNEKEISAYCYDDLINIYGKENILFFPASYSYKRENLVQDTTDVVLRTEVLDKIRDTKNSYIVVTYIDALLEKVVSRDGINSKTIRIKVEEEILSESLIEDLYLYGFEKVDFVFEPGQFSVRGSIIDIFSFAYDRPIRLDFFDINVESIRFFEVETQLSQEEIPEITIIPNIQENKDEKKISFFEYIDSETILWFKDKRDCKNQINKTLTKYKDSTNFDSIEEDINNKNFLDASSDFISLQYGLCEKIEYDTIFSFNIKSQVSINKNFDFLADCLNKNSDNLGINIIMSQNEMQIDRIHSIYKEKNKRVDFESVNTVIHSGFIDEDLSLSIYVDHQLFERYHKYKLRNARLKKSRDGIIIKDLNSLAVGDYVVHIDHGVGVFMGLQKIDVNGNIQETIRLKYRNNDVLFVSIHSLHKISKYKGKDAIEPKINKLGGTTWNKLTTKTKKKVKDIARELISLYAKRKAEKAYSFSEDSYLQEELEASFIYEDTPDQQKATIDIKRDMESSSAMDRLVCGDVGFGKTELAIRAAFKAVNDSKQVAVLVPTTVLAFQHWRTFSKRLEEMPCRVEYISRMRKPSDNKKILKDLELGLVDIIIGTHKLVGKNIKFKDLGLLIVDEEQKFGVAVKEKLKNIKLNVDSLTLTATPIPRTLQFSLMGARDLSIMRTPPPNRYPIETELHTFDKDLIREVIVNEISRNGQVFFVHNRVQNIYEIEILIQKLVPGVRTAVGHGQMDGLELEKVLLGFMRGDYDVLVSTTIIEAGLDVPNANTMIINQANTYGLSDLHQLRGRVGRSNKKAYCYLLAPPIDSLNDEAARRLRAIENFSDLGSGFNIAMQDLDIRGAGNLLGGEQSGFINDIGYEAYQKILKETLQELKETEFKDLFYEEGKVKDDIVFVTDCQIETDKQVLIPDEYVENISERIRLYKELDSIEDLETLKIFREKMIDRFGVPPKNVENLFVLVRVRWLAMKLGIDKIILKNYKLVFFFIADQDSAFYDSDIFRKILTYVQNNSDKCEMSERVNRLRLIFKDVKAIRIIEEILISINA